MVVRLASEWLHACSGCEISMLNMGEQLLEFLEEIEIVHMPVLMDNKYRGQCGDLIELQLPEADIGIVSGGVANREQLEVLKEIREKCDLLIAMGTCATHGGIPAMMNQWPLGEGLAEVFQTTGTDPCSMPDQAVPPPLERVYAVDEQVDVDILLPGCPPDPRIIGSTLRALLEQKDVQLPEKSVCDACPTIRKGKSSGSEVDRFLKNATFKEDQPVSTMRCLLEQGLMCMGPVTAAGCCDNDTPRCITARVPCRGCHGPVRRDGNQMLDMMNALASNSIDFRSIVDRKSILRFSGGHGRLRPLKKRS